MQEFNILATRFNDSILLHKNGVMNMNLLNVDCKMLDTLQTVHQTGFSNRSKSDLHSREITKTPLSLC